MKAEDFIKQYNIKMECEYQGEVLRYPSWKCHHFIIALYMGDRKFICDWYQGLGISKEPPLVQILECLSIDIKSIKDREFEDWATDFGYDPESRKAEAIYKEIGQQAHDLRLWCNNSSVYDAFLQIEEE